MNNWAIWLILLIPVAVSILSLLFRPPKEEPRPGPRMRPNAQEGPGNRPPRRSVSEIDQFLEEINRRRREAAERRRASEPTPLPVPPPEAKPVPPPPPRPVPPPVSKPRRPERPRPVPPRRREPVPEVVRVVVPEPAPLPFQEPPLPALPAEVPALPLPTFLESYRRPPSLALVQLAPLLSSMQTLRSAILLREILDRPISQRPRRGPLR